MNRTIEFVLNKENGKTIYADDFFLKNDNELFTIRTELQKVIRGIREPLFVCYYCGQIVKLNGGIKTKKILHFAHRKDTVFCPLKTDTKYSIVEINRMKYNGAKESPLHFETKHLIKKFIKLNNSFSNIQVEKVLKSNLNYLEWKKPDISANYKKIKIVFEIQLSTTFLSVIVDREYFYKENQTYIIWIFKNFEIDEFKQRFTEKDVFYSNNRNAFVLDDEAINLSQKKNDLYLLCYYQNPFIENLKICYNWEKKYVNFNELIFDDKNFKIFYFDVTRKEEILKSEITILENQVKEKEINQKANLQKIELLKKINIELESEYYDFEEDIEDEIIDYKQKAIREQNISFSEENRSIEIEIRNDFSPSKYKCLFLSQYSELFNKIYDFFKIDYKFTKDDLNFINKEFKNKIESREKLTDYKMIYYISISIFLSKLSNSKELYERYNSKVQQHLFAILSLKKKRVIGSSFNNIIQIVNLYANKKNPKAEYFEIILRAIEVYYGVNEFCRLFDKQEMLKWKIQNIETWKPKQKTNFNDIIEKIFPELKKEKS